MEGEPMDGKDAYEGMTVTELKGLLRDRDLPVGGRKSELVERLIEYDGGETIEASLVDNDRADTTTTPSEISFLARMRHDPVQSIRGLPIPVLISALIVVVASAGGAVVLGPSIIDWLAGEPDYQLIDFDESRARGYAEGLVQLGHPEWKGRLSGTVEETATAEFVKANLTQTGMGATIEEHEVPMFEILSEPSLGICSPGPIFGVNTVAPCSGADFGRTVTEYEHRIDFVLQGYSGSSDIRYGEDITLVDLGNGSAEADWTGASGGVGVVWGKGDNAGNTDLFLAAQENDLRALILVNVQQNCDVLVPDDCVPFFKGVRVNEFESMPAGIGFIMVSKSTGLEIMDEVLNGSARLSMFTSMDNEGTRNVRTVCGVIPGASSEMIIFGAHHDTVYNGPGAVDDTSGTSTVLELGQQLGAIWESKGEPAYTLKFCTWGGEEEGLWGSKAWVEKHREDLSANLRMYVNLDMNHVDAERGDGVWMFGNGAEDMEHIRAIAARFNASYPELSSKYPISIGTLDSEEMPYNSDHAPFVFEIDPAEGPPYGNAIVCYGSGSSEYHTYLDDMSRFNEESLKVSGIIYGSYVHYLAWGETPI